MADRIIKSSKTHVGDISIAYHLKKASIFPEKTVIFIHGFPFNKNMWRKQLENLPDDTTGIAIDVRGHGNSTSGHGFFSIDVFAKDLRGFMEKLGLEKVVLCGASMGGYIALRAYELFPTKIAGLLLAGTHGKADSDQGKQKRFDSIQAILKHGRRPFSIGFIENIFAPDSIENNPEDVELVKSSIRRNSIRTICATLLALAARTDTNQVLPNIQVPTILVRGALDKITHSEDMRYMHKHIAAARYVEIPNSAHLPNMEASQEFNALLSELLLQISEV